MPSVHFGVASSYGFLKETHPEPHQNGARRRRLIPTRAHLHTTLTLWYIVRPSEQKKEEYTHRQAYYLGRHLAPKIGLQEGGFAPSLTFPKGALIHRFAVCALCEAKNRLWTTAAPSKMLRIARGVDAQPFFRGMGARPHVDALLFRPKQENGVYGIFVRVVAICDRERSSSC